MADEICAMAAPERATALLCREVSVEEGNTLMAEAECFQVGQRI